MMSLWLVLLSVAAYTVFFSDFHAVSDIEISGTRDVSADTLDAFIRNGLSGKRLRVFPKGNFFSVPTAAMEQDLLRAFPKLRSVSVSRRFPDGLGVNVVEHDRLLLWCSGGPCYLLDDEGRASEARFAETEGNEPFLIRIIDVGGRPVRLGEPLLPAESVSSVFRLEHGLREDSGIAVTRPFFSPSRVSDELRVVTEEGWELSMNLDIDPDKTIASLRLVLEKEVPQEKRTSLRYIDLRTENRAFFTYKDAAFSQDGAATADPSQGISASTTDTAPPVADVPDSAAKKTDRKKK
jgi:cell division septal protein FtsQ